MERRRCKHLWSLVLRETLLEADLAVDLPVGALVDVVDVLEGRGALGAVEALGVPGVRLGQLPLHLEGLPLAPHAGGRVLLVALDLVHGRARVRAKGLRRLVG